MLWLVVYACLAGILDSVDCAVQTSFSIGDNFTPSNYAISNAPQLEGLSPYVNGTSVRLTPDNSVVTLQYDNEFAGFPYLVVAEAEGDVQVELKYAEQFSALEEPNSDGPWTYSVQDSNMFRVETFNISQTVRIQSFLVQGGQRWESIRLLTSGSVTFSEVGFQLSAEHIPSEQLAGQFSSSDKLLDDIYDLGGRCVQAACVEKDSQPSTWELTSDGALIRSQQTAQSALGTGFSNYTLEFSTKIERGGFIFRVSSTMFPNGSIFAINSQGGPSTFANTNLTQVPRNTVVYNYGYAIQNQTTNPVPPNTFYTIPFPIFEGVWYRIRCEITPTGYNVSANGTNIAFITFNNAFGPKTAGTWGFGAFRDQAAYVKDVLVTSSNGTTLYSNSMTSPDVLGEYGIDTNDFSVCLDGAKRDRLVWIGDFFHTPRTVGASTYRLDLIEGTFAKVFSTQLTSGRYAGLVSIDAQIGTRPQYKTSFENQSYGGLNDYQDEFLVALGDYFLLSGNTTFVGEFWNQTKVLVEARLATISPVTGLQTTGGFNGPANGTATSALTALMLQVIVPIANALGDTEAAQSYTTAARALGDAINSKLWNPAMGDYSLSLSAPNNHSIMATAFAIRAGIANASQAASSIARLSSLRLGVGLKDSSGAANASDTRMSPNTQGFLLDALFIANQTFGTPLDSANFMLRTFWAQMVNQPQYYTGATWEYEFPDGSPGIGLFTSLAHPWGSAPTYVLPQHVLGVSATQPGYKTWVFRPLIYGLGLTNSSGVVNTPSGPINASWQLQGQSVILKIQAPTGTSGVVTLPPSYRFKGSASSLVDVKGGGLIELQAWL